MLDTTALIFAAIMSLISFVAGTIYGFKRGMHAGIAVSAIAITKMMAEAEDDLLQ